MNSECSDTIDDAIQDGAIGDGKVIKLERGRESLYGEEVGLVGYLREKQTTIVLSSLQCWSLFAIAALVFSLKM